MVEFELSASAGKIYIKEPLQSILGKRRPKAMAGGKCIVIYPEGTDPEDLEKSLEFVLSEVRLKKKGRE